MQLAAKMIHVSGRDSAIDCYREERVDMAVMVACHVQQSNNQHLPDLEVTSACRSTIQNGVEQWRQPASHTIHTLARNVPLHCQCSARHLQIL